MTTIGSWAASVDVLEMLTQRDTMHGCLRAAYQQLLLLLAHSSLCFLCCAQLLGCTLRGLLRGILLRPQLLPAR